MHGARLIRYQCVVGHAGVERPAPYRERHSATALVPNRLCALVPARIRPLLEAHLWICAKRPSEAPPHLSNASLVCSSITCLIAHIRSAIPVRSRLLRSLASLCP